MSHSHRYDFDEIPIRNRDGIIVGYAYYEGYADLAVTEENGAPELDYVEAITLHVWEDGCQHQTVRLADTDPLFLTIEAELERLASGDKIAFERSSDFETNHDIQRREYRTAQGY